MKYDPSAYTTYERFLLYQYNITTIGLYYASGEYLIYCPEVNNNTKSHNGENIHEWLKDNKIIGARIGIVNQIPADAQKIDEELANEVSMSSGHLITIPDVEYEIQLLIPKIFPEYNITQTHDGMLVSFAEEVTTEGLNELQAIFKSAKFPMNIRFDNKGIIRPQKEEFVFFETTSTFNKIKSKLDGSLKDLWEKDEDQWLQLRESILQQPAIDANAFRPDSLKRNKLRCLIDTSIAPPDDIRSQLTMYEQICLVAPLKANQEKVLQSLGIDRDELIELVRINKVHVLAPKSIEEYDLALFQDLVDANRTNVHLSRSITGMTLAELRTRNPFFMPPLPTREKQILLSALDESVSAMVGDTKIQGVLRKVIAEMGHGWVSLPNASNQHDSIFLSQFGVTEQLSTIFQDVYNKDIKLTLMAAAPAVDWAAATGSILVPTETDKFSLADASSMIADLYSGVPSTDWVVQYPTYANFAVDEILSIAQHIPVLDLASSFNSVEVARFRKLILDISQHQTDPTEFQETIDAYNHFVKLYEKNKANLASWNMRGFIISLAMLPFGIPFGSWLIGNAFKNILKVTEKYPTINQIVETVDSSINQGIPDAVLVSRMRDKIKKKM